MYYILGRDTRLKVREEEQWVIFGVFGNIGGALDAYCEWDTSVRQPDRQPSDEARYKDVKIVKSI